MTFPRKRTRLPRLEWSDQQPRARRTGQPVRERADGGQVPLTLDNRQVGPGPVTGYQAWLITLRHATRSRAAQCRQAVTRTALRASHNSYLCHQVRPARHRPGRGPSHDIIHRTVAWSRPGRWLCWQNSREAVRTGGEWSSVSQPPQTPVVIIRPTGGVQCPESLRCRDPALHSRPLPEPLLLT